MAKRSPRVEIVPLTNLQPDPQNANKGTERGMGMLEHSLRQYGAGRSALADRNGILIAGNKTLEQAVALGFEEALIVHTEGKQLVVVQRDDLDMDGPDARGLAIADNRVGQVNLDWSAEQLKAWAEVDPEAAQRQFTEREMEIVLLTLPKDEDWAAAAGQLPSGEKAPFQQMTFTLRNDQAEQVKRALGAAKDAGPFADTGNENSNGNALARICEAYLGG